MNLSKNLLDTILLALDQIRRDRDVSIALHCDSSFEFFGVVGTITCVNWTSIIKLEQGLQLYQTQPLARFLFLLNSIFFTKDVEYEI